MREGLDIPEVSLIAIIDADKEGFLRSETSLVQTIGRAARNVDGHVVLYADLMTGSMERALSETNRRREIQQRYNEEHGITPRSIQKKVHDVIHATLSDNEVEDDRKAKHVKDPESMTRKELEKSIQKLEKEMRRAAADLRFEEAAQYRDEIVELRKAVLELMG